MAPDVGAHAARVEDRAAHRPHGEHEREGDRESSGELAPVGAAAIQGGPHRKVTALGQRAQDERTEDTEAPDEEEDLQVPWVALLV